MEETAKTRKLPVIITAIAALIIGAVLGVFGRAAWESSRPEPLLSLDPGNITQIRIQGRDSFSGDSDIITIIDRERIDCIVGLLNGFKSQSQEEFTTSQGCGTQLYLYTADGGVTWVYFDTYSDGRPDAVSIGKTGGGCTRYETASGYFGDLSKMPSTDPSYLYKEPEHPGPTAQPDGT